MKRLTILSIVTASFLMTACGNETTHSENDIRIIKPKKEATEAKAEDKTTETKKATETKAEVKTTETKKATEAKAEAKTAETKKATETKVVESKSETSKINITKTSIGEDKSIIDIIKTVAKPNSATATKVAEKNSTAMSSKDIAKMKESIKSDLKQEFKEGELNKTKEAVKAKIKTDEAKASNAPFDYKLKPKKVDDNVWCFFGALDKPTKENAGFMANSCYVKTKDGYFLMDSGPSYQFAKQAYSAMKKIADLPVKYVVNSHHHDDHWLGNDFYKKEFNATLIGPDSINTNYKEGDKTRMYKVLPQNAIEGTHIIKLDIVPKEKMVVNLGGQEFDIYPMDVKAHTADDVFVYMPKAKVVFGGDLVMNGRINSDRDGAVMGELKAIKFFRSLEWDVLVPGHGLITDKTALDETEQYFTLMKERVSKALEDDVDATEITEKVKEEFKDKAMYDLLNARNVGYAFDELEMLDDE